jgi:hypothetical protein
MDYKKSDSDFSKKKIWEEKSGKMGYTHAAGNR